MIFALNGRVLGKVIVHTVVRRRRVARNSSNAPSARPSGIAARNARLRRGKQATRRIANAPQY